jgi:serine protease
MQQILQVIGGIFVIKKEAEIIARAPVRPMIRIPGKEERPSGVVVVRLAAEASGIEGEKVAETLLEHAKMHGLQGLSQVLESARLPQSHRLVRSIPLEKILIMEREASQTKYPPLHSLTQYWRIDLRDRSRDDISQLVKSLSSLPEVDAAWEEPLRTLPAVNPGDDPYNALQGYQDAAPDGIDARWMWTQPNGTGAGIGIVDVEGGWRVTHEDLAGKAPTLIHGVQGPASWVDHGTAVLGEMVAIDNTVGVVGSAPATNSIRMSSIYDGSGTQKVPDALAAAVAAMSVGQILLIELQINFLPEETVDDSLDLIRLATARGIIVVEAAGNGNTDLDGWTTSGGLHRLNRTSPDFVDSGAIMVGASVSTVPHNRWQWSNYGSRIDCFAWGENVTSTGYGDLDNGGGNADKWYTDTFQGTSSASPIIVSAAALVQSCYQAMAGTLLSPGQMRTLLSNTTTGTAQGTALAGAIGVMPDLAAVVPTLGAVPDVYLRDAVGDTGVIPWTGPLSMSPDVIVRPASITDPQLTYGEASGTENSETLSYDPISPDHDNFIYVRVRNRGGAPAGNVVATVYWSEVGTLITPSTWHLVGSATLPLVPIGDLLTVSPAILWPQAEIPPTGHYCFVATLQHHDDPSPPMPGPLDWNTFYDLIRAHNNVTWRNFNVLDPPGTPDATPSFAFKLVGADDLRLQFAFAVERKLPADAVLELEGPLWVVVRLKGERPWKLVQSNQSEKAQLILPALPRIMLEEILIPPGVRLPCAFKIHPRKGKVVYGHGVAIRQIYKGKEVGRINWQFAQEAFLRTEMRKK